jgi:8-oxo-dGTP pyrophosphatase MutT (NUDIX family)
MLVEQTPDPEVIRAAGGLVWWRSRRGVRVAVIHRPRHRDWSLPKGKLEAGESWQQAALREVREEIGCDARITSLAGVVSYIVRRRAKVVLFWNMRKIGDCSFHPNAEVDKLAWLSPREAMKRLDHPAEKALVSRRKETR